MADVTLTIGDRRHTVACRDGEEDQLRRLGNMLDTHWATAQRAAGNVGGERAMLFVALMLADSLDEAERRPGGAAESAVAVRIAEKLEALAATLEKSGENH
jgi:cell division protein ZapA